MKYFSTTDEEAKKIMKKYGVKVVFEEMCIDGSVLTHYVLEEPLEIMSLEMLDDRGILHDKLYEEV